MTIYRESSNTRPGEPLRSWTDPTDVVEVDAMASIQFAKAEAAVGRLLAGEQLTADDLLAFGRLNSFCVVRWYEPMVTLLPDPFMDPEVQSFLRPLLQRLERAGRKDAGER
jgi:hypothetical protein